MIGVLEFFQLLWSTMMDVLPIATVLFCFQFFVIRKPVANARSVLLGFAFVLVGLTFFLVGLETALFPVGRLMAEQLTSPIFLELTEGAPLDWRDYYWVYAFGFAIGFSTTFAEPALLAVASKASEVSGGAISAWGLRVAVACGVAVGVSLGTYRIVTGAPIHYFIMAGYLIVVVQTFFAPKLIVPIAFDSGGVTTSTVTVPLIAALGLGLAETVPGRNPLVDGFGLIAFACLFPVISVMAYAQVTEFQAQRIKRIRARRDRDRE
ncbi:MAG: hypothetical protein COB04_18520 [Gammaproteobacteria bacterium]|nr:MAG: hypothetical protein COB04_18520 [Gammaproteobacteria bacterium]